MLDLSIMPDTKNGVCYVSFEVKDKDDVSVKLFNMKEELVVEQHSEDFLGQYDAHLDMEGLPDGFYLLQVQVGGRVDLRRIVYRR
jgi:hypothetical protein